MGSEIRSAYGILDLTPMLFRLHSRRPCHHSRIAFQAQQQGGQPQQPSNCEQFVNSLVAFGTKFGGSQTNAGRYFGYQAVNVLSGKADRNELGLDGWQQRYIAGVQNGHAYVHVAGMAGATLIGNDPIYPFGSETGFQRAQKQDSEDIRQLFVGLEAQRRGFTTAGEAGIPGERPDRLIQNYIDEKRAELAGNEAGIFAGRTIEELRARKITAEDARQRIFDRLCVGQRVGVSR